MSQPQRFSVSNILGKAPADPKLTELYTIGKQLGKGAFGVVCLATRMTSGEQLAVKSIAKSKLVCKEDVKDVQAEVAIMNLVAGHQNVVTLKDKDQVHMVMELCAGGELFDSIVEAGCFTERKAAQVFQKMVEVPGERFRDLVGSPYYVAPEVLRKNYSHEADMWSLGVILYILLSGLPPFWGDNEEQIFKMVLKGVIDFKTDPWPKLSAEAKDCVTSLLTQDPSKRATADSVVLTRMANFSQMNKLKKMCMMVVGQNLTPDEIAGLKQLFKSIDEDGNGTITVAELRKAMSSWGHKIGEEEMNALMTVADVDGDGKIDYHEFVAATMHASQVKKEVNALLAVADVDGDSKIDYHEFVAATMHASQVKKDETLLKAFKQLDTDNSGTIEIKELEVALDQFGIKLDSDEGKKQAELKALIASADKNGDGLIDYDEFAFMLRANNDKLQQSRSKMRS
eukprot:gene3870-13934_t